MPQRSPKVRFLSILASLLEFFGTNFDDFLNITFDNYIKDLPYKNIKQITTSISNPERQAFKKVVYIEYPRKEIWTMAMVTGESLNEIGLKFYHIFVPTTPNPTSGYMLYIQQEDTQDANISIEEGLKIIISGGMLAPKSNPLN